MKTLTRVRAPKFRILTSKIMPDLWLVALFCPIKKNSTLHPNVQWVNGAVKRAISLLQLDVNLIEGEPYNRLAQ